jgi:hypothetical protein
VHDHLGESGQLLDKSIDQADGEIATNECLAAS